MNKKLKILFTVSVLLNLLLIGAIAGYVMKCQFTPGPSPQEMSKLSPASRALVTETLQSSRDTMSPIFSKARGLRQQVIDVLQAENFDRAAFIERSAKLRQMQAQIFEKRAVIAAGLAAKMDAEDRKTIAEWLAGPGGKPPGPFYGPFARPGQPGPGQIKPQPFPPGAVTPITH